MASGSVTRYRAPSEHECDHKGCDSGVTEPMFAALTMRAQDPRASITASVFLIGNHYAPASGSAAATARPTLALESLNTDWSQFWPSLIATAIGAFVALLAAIYLERRSRQHDERQSLARKEARRDAVRGLVVDELSRNRNALQNLSTILDEPAPPSSAPTIDVWRALSTEILELTFDAALPAVYYNLNEVQTLLTIYMRELESGPQAVHRARTQTLARLRPLIEQTILDCSLLSNRLQNPVYRAPNST